MNETIPGTCLCGQVTFDVREPEALSSVTARGASVGAAAQAP